MLRTPLCCLSPKLPCPWALAERMQAIGKQDFHLGQNFCGFGRTPSQQKSCGLSPRVLSDITSLSPEASLISRAVRIKAISVDVKWTVKSSGEIGMFIRTRRWREKRGGCERGSGFLPPATLPSHLPALRNSQITNVCSPFVH